LEREIINYWLEYTYKTSKNKQARPAYNEKKRNRAAISHRIRKMLSKERQCLFPKENNKLRWLCKSPKKKLFPWFH